MLSADRREDDDAVPLVLCRLLPYELTGCAAVSHAWHAACHRAVNLRTTDFSLGAEPVRIPVDRSNARAYPAAEYSPVCVGASLTTRKRMLLAQTLGCKCKPGTCGSQEGSTCTCCGTPSAPLAYDANGLLRQLLSSACEAPILECHDGCTCGAACINRVVGRGVRVALTIFRTHDGRGWGVRTREPLPRGRFVCEYAGELLSSAEAAARRRAAAAANAPATSNYVMSVVEHVGTPRRALVTTIDPSRCGNVGRFLNHSCAPNLAVRIVRVGSALPRAAFFCARDVAIGEELTFRYGGTSACASSSSSTTTTASEVEVADAAAEAQTAAAGRRPCRCGAAACTGYLPLDEACDGLGV